MIQHTTKPTIRLVWPAKTLISLRIRAVWSESSLIAYALNSLQAVQRGMNENSCHIGFMYRLIWVFASRINLIVGFVVAGSYINILQLKKSALFGVMKMSLRKHAYSNTLKILPPKKGIFLD